jgi:outer membrane receptor protein involved in Fe transport
VLTSVVFTPTSWNPSFDSILGQYPYSPILGPNPLAVMEQIEASDDIKRFIGSVAGRFRPTPSLTIQYLFGMDDYRQEVRFLQPPFSTGPTFQGSIQNPVRTSRQINHDLTATHGYQASPTVGLSTTIGFRYATDMINEVRAAASNLAPEQETVGGGVLEASQFVSEIRTVGGFAEERVSLADRLFISGGLNVEASSSFGADQRWQLFPRLGASYVLGETERFRNSGLGRRVSTLRLRAAYGETGAPPPGGYTRFDNYVGVSHGGKAGLVASTAAGNAELKPERQREIEGGFDLGLFDDRALLEFTYYHKRTFDLVLDVPQPPSTGFQTRRENIGELTNRGWEAALTTVNLNRAGLRWRSTLSLAHNKNRVEKLVTSADTLVYGYLNAVIEGQPIGVFYGGIYGRNPDGSIAYAPVVPVTGTPGVGATRSARRSHSPIASSAIEPEPDRVVLTTVELGRRLELSLLLDGRFGLDVANFTRRSPSLFGADQVIGARSAATSIPRTSLAHPAGRISSTRSTSRTAAS